MATPDSVLQQSPDALSHEPHLREGYEADAYAIKQQALTRKQVIGVLISVLPDVDAERIERDINKTQANTQFSRAEIIQIAGTYGQTINEDQINSGLAEYVRGLFVNFSA